MFYVVVKIFSQLFIVVVCKYFTGQQNYVPLFNSI